MKITSYHIFKKILFTLIIISCLLSFTKADDIRDFEIESISIGDSLLEHFEKKQIEKFVNYDDLPSDMQYRIAEIYNGQDLNMTNYDATDGDHFRVKMTKPVGKGSMKFFYDIANMEDDSMSYMWLSYTHTCYKGDAGTVTISPTYRYQDGGYVSGTFDEDYNRTKFEITTEIKFY